MGNNPQVGRGLLVQSAPLFPGFVVVDNTWKEKDASQVQANRDGASNMYNYTGWSPGQECSCDWWVKAGTPRAKLLDVITESLLIILNAQPTVGTTIIIGTPTSAEHTITFAAAAGAGACLIGASLLATGANLAAAITAAAAALCTPVVNNADGVGVQIDQVTPWTQAIGMGVVGGTSADVTVNGVALPDFLAPLVARTFVVAEPPETNSFGGRTLKQTVKLAYHTDGFVPEIVT